MEVKDVIKRLNIDPSAIKALEGEVKKSGYDIPYELARELMVKFWAMKATTSEWVTKAKRLTMVYKHDLEKSLSLLKSQSDEKSEAAKEREAKSSEDYNTKSEAYNTAKVVEEFLVMKRVDLEQAHFMCKDLLKDYSNTRQNEPSDAGSF